MNPSDIIIIGKNVNGGYEMELFNIICGVCSILGLLVSLFTASKVLNISQTLNSNNNNDHSTTTNKNTKSTFHGSYVGRDSINEPRSSQ